MDKTQQSSKCRLCVNRNETINHIISECSKLAEKEYKTRHDWMSKVINWEMCKKLKFDHMNKWYMHNPASVLENDTHKLLWDFDIQTDPLISARRLDFIIINKKKRELAKLWTLLSQLTTELNWREAKIRISTSTLLGKWKNYETWKWQLYQSWLVLWYSHQRIIKANGGFRGRRTSGDYPGYSIIENAQNTEKSSGDLRRLAVTQTPVKNHQLKLMWKTLKE